MPLLGIFLIIFDRPKRSLAIGVANGVSCSNLTTEKLN